MSYLSTDRDKPYVQDEVYSYEDQVQPLVALFSALNAVYVYG
jgi:hypothetical protein